ncbi:M16 family metallopeptidase [Solitalea koreensis]|uniref:Predicted Zn-dependent peptidase n=1 Tax=Solitalea koreensis TaxID=543615 RepID=A0A521EBT4_9SPHI|nr:pitrilysin family protein [Solitalea koreensis]SMO81262.1 Predicted Zn-dependent peptidase [Solitalea koreensis]
MKKRLIGVLTLLLFLAGATCAQKVDFTEYNLDNGLHVIFHKDNSAPVVTVSAMYHVGSKNEELGRTGFAHFFEHLLFEGSENIKRGEFMKIVSNAGGENNANTTQDRTYYYETLPSNELETGLWLESERMLHPVINEIGVKTQNEVVKEEKRQRIDNQPYGRFAQEVFSRLFKNHPYRWQPIGSMEDLDAAKLDEFITFFKKYYVPNNAVLVVAGDFDTDKTKKLINSYFSEVPKGATVVQPTFQETPITKAIVDTVYDANIQIPAIISAYRMPGMKDRDSFVLNMISTVLSEGPSSRLSKKMVDEKKNALQVGAFPFSLEDYGAYITYAIPNGDAKLNDLLKDIDEEVVKMQTELISEHDFQKLQNIMENNFVNANKGVEGIANNLADAYTFHNNTNLINTELSIYRSITREEIRDVAKKYLGTNQRVLLYYLPKNSQ